MQRLTMLPAATLLTTGCRSKQGDAARIEADRTVHRSDAPSADAEARVHQEARGWVPGTIVTVIEGRRPVSHP